MTRIEEIRQVAAYKYKDSDFRVPNMYCFIEGAQWADANSQKWLKFTEQSPQEGELIALAVINDGSLPTSYKIIEYETTQAPKANEKMVWYPLPRP